MGLIMRSKKHTGKSRKEKEHYVRTIRRLPYDSTSNVDIDMKYDSSDNPVEEVEAKGTRRVRSKSITKKIWDKIKEKLFFISVSALLITLLAFMMYINRDIGRLETTVSFIKDKLKDVADDIKSMSGKMSEQDNIIRENKMRLDYIEASRKRNK